MYSKAGVYSNKVLLAPNSDPRGRLSRITNIEEGSAPVAQLAARGSHNPKVASSILAGSTRLFVRLLFFVIVPYFTYLLSYLLQKVKKRRRL